jgi:3alpha(or 20beta)-hydroxysteroid dehydrogenase
MTNRLEGKVALVSGAARGMGASHAEHLAREGAKVVLGDIRDEIGQAETTRLRSQGLDVRYVHLDVTQQDDWKAAVETTVAEFGILNVLVNNAGIEILGGLLDDGWDRTIAVNQAGCYYGMRAAVPAMLEHGGGAIVNISSINGFIADAGTVRTTGEAFPTLAYCTSKAAIRMMTKCVAAEFATRNIRANAICPGAVDTPMFTDGDQGANLEDVMEPIAKAHPMHRMAQPKEISQLVVFLASDESSYMTGSDVVIDGGLLTV